MKETTQVFPIPKSAKETLYNSLMQSWQKISAYDQEEKNNHILIAESYGLDELVKYFNDTIDE